MELGFATFGRGMNLDSLRIEYRRVIAGCTCHDSNDRTDGIYDSNLSENSLQFRNQKSCHCCHSVSRWQKTQRVISVRPIHAPSATSAVPPRQCGN